eukprot:g27096.t1
MKWLQLLFTLMEASESRLDWFANQFTRSCRSFYFMRSESQTLRIIHRWSILICLAIAMTLGKAPRAAHVDR